MVGRPAMGSNQFLITNKRYVHKTEESINKKHSKDAPMKVNTELRGSFQAFLHFEEVGLKILIGGDFIW